MAIRHVVQALAGFGPAPSRQHRRPAGEAGFSLAESLLAAALSVTVLAGVMPVYFQAVHSTLLSHGQSVAAMLAAARLEQLRGLTFRYEDSAAGSAFRVTDDSTDLAAAHPTPGGRGLASSPPETLLRDTAGYVDYLDVSGQWLAGGDAPPAGAHYVRRWAVLPLPANPTDALVLQVLVTPLAPELAAGPRVNETRRPGDVWLTLVRTRVQ